MRPAGKVFAPIWIMPRKKVPVVRTSAPQGIVSPIRGGRIPSTRPFFRRISAASASITLRCCDVPVIAACIALPVELAVGLRSRAAHGRAFGAVQNAKLDAGLVRDPSHKPVEGIDFAHEMAFAEPADGGIAGHCADRGKGKRDERGLCAHPRGRRRGLAAGMAAADHDHIKHGIRVFSRDILEQI